MRGDTTSVSVTVGEKPGIRMAAALAGILLAQLLDIVIGCVK
jgi:hypothetical protein